MSLNDKDLARLARETGLTDDSLGDFMTDYGYSKDHIRAFADAVAKLTTPAWQPIDTAPYSALALICVQADEERRVFVAWRDFSTRLDCWRWLISVGPDGWRELTGDWTPTHWMPLPEPPKA